LYAGCAARKAARTAGRATPTRAAGAAAVAVARKVTERVVLGRTVPPEALAQVRLDGFERAPLVGGVPRRDAAERVAEAGALEGHVRRQRGERGEVGAARCLVRRGEVRCGVPCLVPPAAERAGDRTEHHGQRVRHCVQRGTDLLRGRFRRAANARCGARQPVTGRVQLRFRAFLDVVPELLIRLRFLHELHHTSSRVTRLRCHVLRELGDAAGAGGHGVLRAVQCFPRLLAGTLEA
jgi:hypothetical protein